MADAINLEVVESFVEEEMVAIHCKTYEEAYELIEYLMRTRRGDIDCPSWGRLNEISEQYGDRLCFEVWGGELLHDTACNYRNGGYNVVEFSDIFADEDLVESELPLDYLM